MIRTVSCHAIWSKNKNKYLSWPESLLPLLPQSPVAQIAVLVEKALSLPNPQTKNLQKTNRKMTENMPNIRKVAELTKNITAATDEAVNYPHTRVECESDCITNASRGDCFQMSQRKSNCQCQTVFEQVSKSLSWHDADLHWASCPKLWEFVAPNAWQSSSM